MEKTTKSSQETKDLAQLILKNYPQHKLWLLSGELASGKTTFVKGLVHQAKSPTFTFLTEHEDLIHYDLYRLEKIDQLIQEQLNEHMNSGKLVLIEWPERLNQPPQIPHLKIEFRHTGPEERLILLTEC